MGRTSRKRQRKKLFFINESRDNNDSIELLKSWMAFQNCAPICDLVPYNFPSTGRGLKTLTNIHVNEVLIKLPLQCLITTATVLESDIAMLFRNNEIYTAQCLLSVFLLFEAHLGRKSKWHPYITSIPCSFNNPEFCKKNEKTILPSFIFNCYRKAHGFQKEFALITKSLRNLNDVGKGYCAHCGVSLKEIITFPKYQWAYYAVNTRTVFLDLDKEQQINYSSPFKIKQPNNLALAPYLDLLNHDIGASVNVSVVTDSGLNKFYQITTNKSFNKNSQVFINYGDHNSLQLYIHYGFFIPNNSLDEVYFELTDIQKCIIISDSALEFIKSNEFDKNLGFTVGGLNYNATVALFIFTTMLPKTYWNMKIFGDCLQLNDLHNVNELAVKILLLKKKELEYHLNRMICIKQQTESFATAINLVKEYIKILNTSLKSLKL